MYDESLRPLEKAIAMKPDHRDAWSYKARSLYLMGRYNESLQAYEKLTEIDPQNGYNWAQKGRALMSLGRSEEAEAAIARAKELGFDEELEGIRQAAEMSPGDPEAKYLRGLDYYYQGRYNEAIKSFDETIELNSSFARAWKDKGSVLRKLGRNQEAEEAFKSARKLENSR